MASNARYLALLRGINVGGKNVIRMPELRAVFEEIGFVDVETYIQSGNVLFSAPRQAREVLAATIEQELSGRLGTELRAVILTAAQLRKVVEGAPRDFGAETHRCDVIFLRKPLTAAKAIEIVELREGVDSAWSGPGALYFARLDAKASGSKLSKLVGRPEYRDMTIRNWRTTRRLLELIASGSGA